MRKIDYLEAQSKLAKTMRQVCQEDTPVTINGAGKDQVVMMPLETFLKLNKPAIEPLDGSTFELLHTN
jgi:PHD/YefM family antitoxin component YafN of YafNO toxin-antitoxin module